MILAAAHAGLAATAFFAPNALVNAFFPGGFENFNFSWRNWQTSGTSVGQQVCSYATACAVRELKMSPAARLPAQPPATRAQAQPCLPQGMQLQVPTMSRSYAHMLARPSATCVQARRCHRACSCRCCPRCWAAAWAPAPPPAWH